MSSELHPDVRAALEERAKYPESHELSVEDARDQMIELSAPTGSPPVGDVTDRTIPGPAGEIPIRVYAPAGEGPFPVLVYLHGGGWVLGTLDTHDLLCRTLSNEVGCLLVSVDYRLAPEHPFPAAVEDCDAALRWVADNAADLGGDPDRLAVGGDSAGGNLTAAVALLARDRGAPALDHQVLLYPVTDDDLDRDSYRENAEDYGLTRESMRWFHDHYLDSPIHAANPYAYPLKACDLAGTPPATVITAEFDPLRDEGVAYAERLVDAGVPVTHRNYADVVHGFVGWLHDPDLDRAREAIDLVAADLDESF